MSVELAKKLRRNANLLDLGAEADDMLEAADLLEAQAKEIERLEAENVALAWKVAELCGLECVSEWGEGDRP